ncbi:MAG TPA: HD domain-containing protein [Gemmatimonadaceae bacterium]|nr:HD domain-containing protein [Gemmatimonadaceae bacterium]
MAGYSDRISHALAFAAKHHDQQVRRGTRLPYLTAAPNVAVILTRYDRDDDTVVSGVLRDVVQDYVRDGFSVEMLEARIGEKFGAAVLAALLGIVERRYDGDGVEMSPDDRRLDLVNRIAAADERGRWVMAAVVTHAAGTLLADLTRTSFPGTVWANAADGTGREGAMQWLHGVHRRLVAAGFAAPIMSELGGMLTALDERAAQLGRGA